VAEHQLVFSYDIYNKFGMVSRYSIQGENKYIIIDSGNGFLEK
jgi:hypothetical protein